MVCTDERPWPLRRETPARSLTGSDRAGSRRRISTRDPVVRDEIMESQEAKLRSTAAAEVPGDCGTCKHAPKRAYIACPRATDGTRNCWEPIDQQKREQKPGWRTTKQVDLVDLAAVQSIIAQEMAGLVPVVLYGINAAACDPKGAYVGNPWPNMPATVTVGGRAFAVGFRLAVREITRYSPEEEADRDNQA